MPKTDKYVALLNIMVALGLIVAVPAVVFLASFYLLIGLCWSEGPCPDASAYLPYWAAGVSVVLGFIVSHLIAGRASISTRRILLMNIVVWFALLLVTLLFDGTPFGVAAAVVAFLVVYIFFAVIAFKNTKSQSRTEEQQSSKNKDASFSYSPKLILPDKYRKLSMSVFKILWPVLLFGVVAAISWYISEIFCTSSECAQSIQAVVAVFAAAFMGLVVYLIAWMVGRYVSKSAKYISVVVMAALLLWLLDWLRYNYDQIIL